MLAWTEPEIEYLLGCLNLTPLDAYETYKNRFGELERSYDSVQKKLLRLRGTIPQTETFADVSVDEIREHRKEVQKWATAVVDEFIQVKLPPVKPVSSESKSKVLILSDLHFGKVVGDRFNLKIARERIETLPERVVLPYTYDELVVIVGGDIVDGEDIFEHQAHTIEVPVIDQLKTATEALWHMLTKFEDMNPHCSVRVETFPGNHGRVTHKANPKTNWDNVLYRQLAILASVAGSKIQVHPNLEDFVRFQVKDKFILGNHKGVKHTGTAAMSSKIAAWNQEMPFDCLVHGHWHKWEVGTVFGKVIVKNGSLCGPDEYSKELGVFDPPRQAYFTVEPGEPITGFGFLEW